MPALAPTSYDFRSDTVTLPTPEMMRAIATAPLGDSARGDDPTVLALERRAVEVTGKTDALFVPSGTMANLVALIGHECRAGEVIVEENAHIYSSEGGGLSAVAGAVPRPVRSVHGVFDPDDLKAALRAVGDLHVASTRLICLENSHNAAGGTVTPLKRMDEIRAIAASAGIPVHLDGARLFNAATHLGVPVRELCDRVDSVWFALCKGLGCPIGAVLAGDAPFMQKARRAAKMVGGAMRQAGIAAAAGLVALEDPYAVHRRDHARARALAEGLATVDPSLVAVERVQTNIVNCLVDRFADDAGAINQALRERGILANHKRTKIRFVTHYHIDDAAVQAAIRAVGEVIRGLPRRS